MKKYNHRPYCRKEARCVKCGRYICEGCNSVDKQGDYGLCLACSAKEYNIKCDTLLPFKPLIMPKNIYRYIGNCNRHSSLY